MRATCFAGILATLHAALAPAQATSFLPPTTAIDGGNVSASCAGCIAIADFNGDGRPDIAFAFAKTLPLAGVVLGNGDGTFGPMLDLPPNPTFVAPIFTGDFNGDGKPDVIGGSSLFLGKGDGTFKAPLALSTCVNFVADLNRDGRTDLICGTVVLLSNGDGTFRNAGTVGSQSMETVVLVADFNGDGIPDIMLHRLSGILSVVVGHGDGTFGAEIILPYEVDSDRPYNPFLAGDFNGDGKTDLATLSSRGLSIDVLPGNGDGTFGALVQTEITYPGSFNAAADFNKDGKLDILAGNLVCPGNGDGTFRFPISFGPVASPCGAAFDSPVPVPCDYGLESTVIADFNGDGFPDIAADTFLASGPSEQITVLLNDSPGNGFTTQGMSSATGTWPVGPGSIVSAFGENFTLYTAVAGTNPAPTTLGGIRLHVRDRSHTGDQLAPLLYVSPTQINYILNSSDPYAFVDIERVGVPYVPQGMTVPIQAIAPGFYTTSCCALKGGVAVATALQSSSNGTLTPVSVTPIDLANGPVYLSLYGTGFAQASAAASSCSLADNINLQILYAGPEVAIAGLDQVNLLLPKTLAGTGLASLACTFVTAQQIQAITNTVTIFIR